MATTSRASARFFSAFYRWSCSAHCRPQCTPPLRDLRHNSLRIASPRSFTTTRANGQAAEHIPVQRTEDAEAIAPIPGGECNKGDIGEVARDTLGARLPKGKHQQHRGPQTEKAESTTPRDDPVHTEGLRHSVRSLMRNVPHPIVVLTAAAPHPHEDMPLGIAVSSFNTVTLDPPTISFNVRHPSQTLDAIRRDNGRFRIHFLSRRPHSARIAHSFTQGNHHETYQERRALAEMDTSGKSFSKAAHIKDAHVTASMQCELTQEMTVGDHVIAVAKVSALTATEPKEPLLMYVQGRYVDGDTELLHHRPKLKSSN